MMQVSLNSKGLRIYTLNRAVLVHTIHQRLKCQPLLIVHLSIEWIVSRQMNSEE